jgi:transcriptional regulator with XRE-family HTH domain
MTPNQVKAWRKKNGYSQSQLARALGVNVMTVSRWERGFMNTPPFLHLALKWLELEGGENKTPRAGKKKGDRA